MVAATDVAVVGCRRQDDTDPLAQTSSGAQRCDNPTMDEDRQEQREQEVFVEIDGPQVSPGTVDALMLLRLAQAYYDLLVAEAQEIGMAISLRGLDIKDKCAATVTTAEPGDAAQRAAHLSNRHIAGIDATPTGLRDKVRRARAAVLAIPLDFSAKIIIGPWNETLAALNDERFRTSGLTKIRARVLRIGGKEPKARFFSFSEQRGERADSGDFSLNTDAETARKLGASLYEEVEIRAHMVRDRDGTIDSEGSKLIDFRTLELRDAAQAWREWFLANASEWQNVEDLEAELADD